MKIFAKALVCVSLLSLCIVVASSCSRQSSETSTPSQLSSQKEAKSDKKQSLDPAAVFKAEQEARKAAIKATAVAEAAIAAKEQAEQQQKEAAEKLAEDNAKQEQKRRADIEFYAQRLYLALRDGKDKEAINILNGDVTMKEIESAKNYPWVLGAAAEECNIPFVELMLSKGANVNENSLWGMTPLMRAAGHGNIPLKKERIQEEKMRIELVKLLLKAGADPKLKTANNRSAIDFAKLSGFLELTEMLEDLNAK